MKPGEIWKHIHPERAQMADTWTGLSVPQWAAPSWCQGWSVQDTAGHIVAAAEQTPVNFYKEMTAAGFKFNVFTDRGARSLAAIGPDELARRLRARTSTTNHPPAPVLAMLGEIVVHGQDIRRPLGLPRVIPSERAETSLNFLTGKVPRGFVTKDRLAGLALSATDVPFSSGSGAQVTGPAEALLLVLTGRPVALADLSGDGVAVLRGRISPAADTSGV